MTPSSDQPPQTLTPERIRRGIDLLKKRLVEVEKFDPTSITDQHNIPQVDALSVSIDEALVRIFGSRTDDYRRYSDAAVFDNGPFNYAFTVPISKVHEFLVRSKSRSIALLGQAISSLEERLEEYLAVPLERTSAREDEWISAADAVRLLSPSLKSDTAAQIAICHRAHSGLVRARATCLLEDGKRFENHEIPREFWWAEGELALKQNWTIGDFDTWIEQNYHWQAFGVLFLRSGIDLMIPKSALAAAPSSPSCLTESEEKILHALTNRLPTAALSYEQALLDLSDLKRVSFRGTAHELREAVREVLDQLAPDEKVKNEPGFKFEKDRTKPTMKQKVRFIFKDRKRTPTAEDAVDAIAEVVASMARSTYDRGSMSAHTGQSKDEVLKVKRYAEAVLHDILEI